MSESFLVYDGRNTLFRTGAHQVARVSAETRLVPWRAKSTREFLEAQFGDQIFAFVLINPEANCVHVGGKTVRRLLIERGVPQPIGVIFQWMYELVGDQLGRLIHGQTPADINGSFHITEAARPHIESLRQECSLASCEN